MPPTRLLVVADSKMLPALANGLRDGGKFDVLTVPLADSASAQSAAERADALALFYGAPDKPLPAALQALAPKVRERGGRVVAVLKRDQAAQRDECFRAGASDLLFMPMPKDEFLARLAASVGLSWTPEAGTPAPVSIATRTATTKIEYAAVSSAGVEAPGELPVKSGDTVRMTWGSFQAWGLVVRGGPSVQIRFAGLAPDEEAMVREWLKNGVQSPQVAAKAAASTARAAAAPAASTARAAAAPAAATTRAAAAPAAAKPSAPSGAPAAGPPPGFADRKPVKPQTPAAQPRPPARVAPPVMAPGNSAGAVAARSAAAEKSPAQARPVLPGLFDEGPSAAPGAAEGGGAAPSGPPWPAPAELGLAKAVAFQFIREKTVSAETPPALAASAKKIPGMLSSGERVALENAGPESHFADALGARILLDAATSDGVVLYGIKGMPNIDPGAVSALVQLADAAAARLQAEANEAIGKGQVEQLQMVTAASAALSRDLLAFKETADRLRGVGSAPRLAAGGLDPELVLPGQQARPRTMTPAGATPIRAELRDFQGLEARGGRGKTIALILGIALFAAALSYALFFALPQISEISTEEAGPNVVRIDVSGAQALVVVNEAWADNPQQVGKLVEVLRRREIQSALVRLPSGASVGILDVKLGRLVVTAPKPPPAPPK